MADIRRVKQIASQAINLFKVPNDNPQLTLSQFEAFSKQVPLLYFILVTNMISLASTHAQAAPVMLVVYVPAVISLLCTARAIGWLRQRNVKLTAAEAYRKLKATNLVAGPMTLACTAWSLSLLPYGDAYQQAHVAFFMAITVIGCIFCLMHLRSAAFMVTIIVNTPFFVFMVLSGEPTFIATGVNVILVSMALIAILITHYRDFRQLNVQRHVLMEQQQALQDQNNAMQVLSDENLRLANLDSLTQIANRRSFFHNLESAFERARQDKTTLAVGVIDLDGFKPVNDMYGHAAGDKVLIEVADRLQKFVGPTLSVYRLGGDEFALIVRDAPDEAAVHALGTRSAMRLLSVSILVAVWSR